MDARFVVGYNHPRNHVAGILLLHHVLDPVRKGGSNIASEIGTMRVTQQIDALEIMGVNSAGYLILPKIIALMTMIPFLVIFSISSGLLVPFAPVVRRSHECPRIWPMVCNIVFRNGLYGAVLLIYLFRFHHFQCICLFRLHGRRRFYCSR